MKHANQALLLAALAIGAADAGAVTINFDGLAVGATLSTQYAGVVFSANAMTGSGYATNTDMTIVSATGTDVGFGGLGTPNLASGNVLRSFAGWLNETGDPSFRVSFANPVVSFSADFAGVYAASNVRLYAYDGSALLTTVTGTSTADQFTLAVTGTHITSVIVTPGTLDDYVAVDNLQYVAAPVPEPAAWALLALGLPLLTWAGRRGR